MEPNIAEGFFIPWVSVTEIYGKKENIARIFKLHVNINKIVEEDKSFHIYLNNLKSLWDKLWQYHPLITDLETIKKGEEQDKTFKLLVGLDQEFDNIRGIILIMQPMPSFSSICTIVQREETWKKVILIENNEKEAS